MLTLHNGITAAVHIPALADARGYVEFEGLGEPPFKTWAGLPFPANLIRAQ